MVAFVQNVGLGATRAALPQSGLRSICATPARPVFRDVPLSRSSVQMAVTKVNQSITLQTLLYEPTPAISGVEDKDIICYRVWKQVFGNAYVMESERAEAYIAESMYRAGQIPLREFVRGVAMSSTYRRRFFECCGTYRAVELNFKHLLGRGPNSKEEASEHVQRIINEGYEAEINSYIDSEEYEEAFGNDFVPYSRFKGTYPTIVEFNNMCALNSYPGTTDKSLSLRARSLGIPNPNTVLSLQGAGITPRIMPASKESHVSFVSIKNALPMRPDLGFGISAPSSPVVSAPVINENAAPVRRVEISMGSYMYLTQAEEAEYKSASLNESKIVALAETEIRDAQAQIEALQAKVAELSLVV